MSQLRILDVGNCVPDHSTLTRYLTKHFDCVVDEAVDGPRAMQKLKAQKYDLVLVNRKLDADYSDGLDVIRTIKSEEETQDVPVMMITNYADHQDAAEAAGALRGFGKLEYDEPATLERLKQVLTSAPAS
jgi:CheY-like chemotaxis protein